MTRSHLKMGFWAVLAFVISSQVGSGIFLFPAKMAPLGDIGFFAWILTGSRLSIFNVFVKLHCQIF
jgi:APA family basic amino acid/polyamine antiporter